MNVYRLPVRRNAITEVQILRARYDEARAIKEAWDFRLHWAQAVHADAVKYGGDTDATRRSLAAVEIQVADAAGELKVALNAWMAATIPHHERRTA